MKGTGESPVILVTVVLLLVFILASYGILNRSYGQGGLIEQYSVKGISENLVKDGMQKYLKQNQDFLNSVNSIFTGDSLQQKCSDWYNYCMQINKSPWNNRPNLKESDYDDAIAGIKCDNAPAIKDIEDMWSKSNLGNYIDILGDEGQRITLVRNACEVNMADQIHKQQDLYGSGGGAR